ncbi:ABC transporter permease [Pseudemcibacter aquimaris]|uniref:ABC transporter permease n=1 Tax=Pseudemcibacter aquimaris TaxID=2857064 RepID=UPI00201175BD|nr:ABC transporter permease [Pseudemcibacter aquimaris]MCC3861282.1 ABC transporter permease [Pseudemcibacter aquimaris]WDU58056.1 ABC transporter permease [Pseudemcibacter aquimaris]
MLLNHIHMAFRSILKQRLYSTINIVGLAAGLAVAILIILFVNHESSFDSNVPNNDRVYRLNWESTSSGARFATFFNPLSPVIADAYPNDVEDVSRIALTESLLTIGDNKLYQTVSFVDPNYFEFFGNNFIQGNQNALKNQNNMVLSRIAADTLFPGENPIGKTITIDGQHDFQVTAIIENNESNSHQVSNIYAHMEMLPVVWNDDTFWERNFSDQLYHYIRLAPNVSGDTFAANAHKYIKDNISSDFAEDLGVYAQSLKDIHFNTELQNEMTVRDTMTGLSKPGRQKSDISIFAIVAILAIVIATFNFVNMQIAQSSNRTKEVGVRKVLGASRKQIAAQFIVESTLMALIALICALVLVEMFSPFFGSMLGVPLTAAAVYNVAFMGGLILLAVMVGIISGLYPALIVSGILPAIAVRGRAFNGVGSAKLRATLVVMQFAIAIGLMSATGIVNDQINFALNGSLGYEPENVITVSLNNSEARNAYQTMHDQLLANPAISAVSSGSIIPTGDLSDGSVFQKEGEAPDFQIITRRVSVNDGYFDTLGMEMAAGRPLSKDFLGDIMPNFSPENPTVSGGIILNETAARQAGWTDPNNAVGEQIYTAFSFGGTDYRLNFNIVGIVKDIHFGSVRSEPASLSFLMTEGVGNKMVIKAEEGALNAATAAIDNIWAQHVTEYPIRRTYLEEDYASFYAVEGRVFRMFIGFAGITAMIACIGLYGLASFIADRRTKEIGIRKVLGASVMNIVTMLSWELSKLVLIANVIAWPVAWIMMNDWLMAFNTRIDMSILPYLIAGVVAFVLAYATTSIKAWGAATINPVYSLKSE